MIHGNETAGRPGTADGETAGPPGTADGETGADETLADAFRSVSRRLRETSQETLAPWLLPGTRLIGAGRLLVRRRWRPVTSLAGAPPCS